MPKFLSFLLVFSFVGAVRASVPADAVLSDFPRLAGETDDAPRFRRAVSAAPNGVLSVGKGEYAIATPIVITNRCSLEMHPAAHLMAVKEMDFILTWDGHADYHALSVFNADGSVYDNAGLYECPWKNVVWSLSTASGGANMSADALKLWQQTPVSRNM